jgi:radical SAM superfamily enzyme YgiQ (UPF0313 family)
MRVLLIQPPIEDFYTTPIRFYPLGLLYVAAILQGRGHEVAVLDCLTPFRKRQRTVPADFRDLIPLFQNRPLLFKHYYHFGMTHEEVIMAARDWQPDLLGWSSLFTAYFDQVEELARQIHERLGIPQFMGGHHASAFAGQIRERLPFLDAILTGPAESSLPTYMARWDKGSVHPIEWRSLAPAHGLLAGAEYRIAKKHYVSMTASRGCPFRCDFCSIHALFGHRIEYRTVESVLEEMRWNCRHKQAGIINFEDDNLAWKREWFLSLLRGVQADPVLQNLELTAMNGLCHATLDQEVLEQMRRAGFKSLNLSFVSNDEEIRRQYHRPAHHEFAEIVRHAQQQGMFVTAYVIIGLPEQTYDEIKAGIDYLLDLGVLVGPSVFYIPPASPLFERLSVQDATLQNWRMYRSSAFAVETPHLSREQLLDLFQYAREKNVQARDQAAAGQKR